MNSVHLIFISSEYFILYPEKCSPIIYIAPPFWFNLIYQLPLSLIPQNIRLFPFFLVAILFFGIAPSVIRFHRKKIIYENYHGNLLYFLIIPLSFFRFVSFLQFSFGMLLLCCINPFSNKKLMDILNPKKDLPLIFGSKKKE